MHTVQLFTTTISGTFSRLVRLIWEKDNKKVNGNKNLLAGVGICMEKDSVKGQGHERATTHVIIDSLPGMTFEKKELEMY